MSDPRMKKEVTILELGGQKADVKIIVTENGVPYATFLSEPGYGAPALEQFELEYILRVMQELRAVGK